MLKFIAMDSCYYCVFWFPTIFHCEKKHKNPEFPVSIADDDDDKNLLLEIKEEEQASNAYEANDSIRNNEKKCDLIFTLTDQNGHKIESRFSCVNQTRNGFVVYSYNRNKLIEDYWNRFNDREYKRILDNLRHRLIDRIKKKYPNTINPDPDDELVKNYTIDRILISFYHNAKLFYHEHETHKDSDAKLRAYYYSKEYETGRREYLMGIPCLSIKNNPVINWYIDQFEKQLIGNAENISDHHKRWSKDLEDTFNLKRRVNKALDENNKQEILNLIGEITSKSQKGPLESDTDTPPDIIDVNEIGKNIDNPKEHLTNIYQKSLASYINYLYEELSALSKECTDSIIEYTYCKTLLGSKYNDDYKQDFIFTNTELRLLSKNDPVLLEKDSKRKKAFNIQNSICYIEAVRQKCDFWGIRITEMLMEEVLGISKNNRDILKNITSLTDANNDILQKIKSLTTANNDALKEAEKSNENSSILGWLSFSIAIWSLGGLESCHIWKCSCFAAAVIVFGIYYIGRWIKKRKNSSK